MAHTIADQVRGYCRKTYVEPARRRGEGTVTIVAGEVQKALRLANRTPAICQVLSGQMFIDDNSITLEKSEGPPSGLSTTMKYTYALNKTRQDKARLTDLLSLRGIASKTYRSFGGGEAYLRELRHSFYRDEPGKR